MKAAVLGTSESLRSVHHQKWYGEEVKTLRTQRANVMIPHHIMVEATWVDSFVNFFVSKMVVWGRIPAEVAERSGQARGHGDKDSQR